MPPRLGEETATLFRILGDDRGGFKIPDGKIAECVEDLLVGIRPRIAEHRDSPVAFQPGRQRIRKRQLLRQLVDNRKLQHPAVEVERHHAIPNIGIEELRLELLHLPEALLGRRGPDTVQQLVEVDVGERGGYRAVDALADLRAPREVAPQLGDGQVVVGREVAFELPAPRRVVLVILHKLALPVEVETLLLVRAVAVLVHSDHLQNGFRNSRFVGHLTGFRQGDIGRDSLRATLTVIEHDGAALPCPVHVRAG